MASPESTVAYPRELVTYERCRGQLKGEDIGKIALVHGEQLMGVYNTGAEACAEAKRFFGKDRFLLKQIGAPEEFLYLGEGPVAADSLRPAKTTSMEEGPPEVYWARENATYERCRSDLERQHMHKVALIYGAQLVGVFDTLEAASEEGARRFGLEKFMIREIGDPIHFFPLGVLPGTAGYAE